jgi:hypothetical protein
MSHRTRLIAFTLAALVLSCASSESRSNALIDTRVRKAEFTLTPPPKLFSAIFTDRLKKSEFETDAQYRARLAQMRPTSTYFMTIPTSFLRYVYHAELQRLVVMVPQVSTWITVSYSSEHLGKTPMQNAFGATVETTLIKSNSLELDVQNSPKSFPKGVVWQAPSTYSSFMSDVGLGLPVSIAPAIAERVVKKKSYGLVVGFTVGDLARASRDRGGVAPTFNSPIGIGGYTSRLPVNVTYLAVLDRDRNDVVASWHN